MRKEKRISKSGVIVLLDPVYNSRRIEVDGHVFEVKHGRVTVDDQEKAEMLQKQFGLNAEEA